MAGFFELELVAFLRRIERLIWAEYAALLV
jgi:hypothetical protein